MTYTIDKNIPLPTTRSSYPFGKMEVGDSFAVEPRKYHTVAAASSHYGKRTGTKYALRRSGDVVRIWRTK